MKACENYQDLKSFGINWNYYLITMNEDRHFQFVVHDCGHILR